MSANVDQKSRYAVDWTFTDYQATPNLNDVRSFPELLYKNDPQAKRISFVLANGTVKRKEFSSELFTTDPRIHDFYKTFLYTNPQIDPKKVRTYVFTEKSLNPFSKLSDKIDDGSQKFFGYVALLGIIAVLANSYFSKRK